MNTTLTAIVILPGLIAAAARAEEVKPFKNEKEKISYAIGLDSGNRMRQSEIDVDFDLLTRGLKDGLSGQGLLAEPEMRETFTKLRQDIMNRQHEKQRELGEKNQQAETAFLAANKGKPGVVTLSSGLQYTVLAEGAGPSPKPEDSVVVNYRGTLIDGTEFDRSPEGQPASFPANGVIRGWTEALTRMKAGSKWKLFIPAELAYGAPGRPPKIGPNALLIFDVELLSFVPAVPAPTPPPAHPPLTSDIIKVPSLEEMKKGAKIETIKAEDVDRLQKEAAEKGKEEKK